MPKKAEKFDPPTSIWVAFDRNSKAITAALLAEEVDTFDILDEEVLVKYQIIRPRKRSK